MNRFHLTADCCIHESPRCQFWFSIYLTQLQLTQYDGTAPVPSEIENSAYVSLSASMQPSTRPPPPDLPTSQSLNLPIPDDGYVIFSLPLDPRIRSFSMTVGIWCNIERFCRTASGQRPMYRFISLPFCKYCFRRVIAGRFRHDVCERRSRNYYCWRLNGDSVMSRNLPAPSDVLKLVCCGCKSGCVSGRCNCFRQKTCCTELCACDMCENEDLQTPADCDADDID